MLCLFDLDGTLIDSEPGISACIRHALHKLDVPEPAELRSWIGPPLRRPATRRQTGFPGHRALGEGETRAHVASGKYAVCVPRQIVRKETVSASLRQARRRALCGAEGDVLTRCSRIPVSIPVVAIQIGSQARGLTSACVNQLISGVTRKGIKCHLCAGLT